MPILTGGHPASICQRELLVGVTVVVRVIAVVVTFVVVTTITIAIAIAVAVVVVMMVVVVMIVTIFAVTTVNLVQFFLSQFTHILRGCVVGLAALRESIE